jgi:hypothetical protein
MVFRNDHHRYVLRDGSHKLNNIRVPDLLKYRQLMPERISVTNEKKHDLLLLDKLVVHFGVKN